MSVSKLPACCSDPDMLDLQMGLEQPSPNAEPSKSGGSEITLPAPQSQISKPVGLSAHSGLRKSQEHPKIE